MRVNRPVRQEDSGNKDEPKEAQEETDRKGDNNNKKKNNERISRELFHVKHAQMR